MSSWALRRKILILLSITTVIIVVLYFSYQTFFNAQATCSDGIANGAEEGVDCGGGCQLVCPFAATESNVLYSRAFQIVDGVYNVMALVENPNFDLQMTQSYKFQLYNSDNVLVEEVTGIVTLQPAEIRPIFEPSINVGEREIASSFFSFMGEPILVKSSATDQPLVVRSRELIDQDSNPELYVTLFNSSIRPVRNTEVVAVLYDKFDNVHQASKTFVEYIDRDSAADIFFTWPQPFTEEIRKIDIFLIQSVNL